MAKKKIPDDLVNRLAAFNATADLMKSDEAAESMHSLATDLVGILPFRARLRIAIRMALRRLRRRLRFWKE